MSYNPDCSENVGSNFSSSEINPRIHYEHCHRARNSKSTLTFSWRKWQQLHSLKQNKTNFKNFHISLPPAEWSPVNLCSHSKELRRALSGRCCVNLLVSVIYSGALVYKTEHCLVEFHCSNRLSGAQSLGNNQYFLPRPLWPGTWQYLSLWWPFCPPVPQHLLEVGNDRVE